MTPTYATPAAHQLARRADPVTSHAAAARAHELAPHHGARIVQALQEHGPMSKTGIAAVTGISDHAVSRRPGELQAQGLICLTGETRRSAAGRAEREWRAAQ
jgi:predicted ArsR family transcriptional regulator